MVAFLAGAALFSSSFARAEDIQLFNGKDFSNWHGRTTIDPKVYATKSDAEKAKWNDEIKTHWKIEGNEIVNDGKGAYLTTNEDYEDFDFEFEYKIVANCDSGIYLRGIPQVQIWDPTSEASKVHGAEKGSGGLWNNPAGWAGKDPIVRADKPAGEWNKMKIRLVGERCTVWLNDQTVVKHARLHNYFAKGEPLPKSGPIQLQTHGAEIRFRNLKLSTHDAETANKLLAQDEVAAMDNAKFESLFNGKDLAGWAGATSNYTVVDGAIQCMKGKGACFTRRRFTAITSSALISNYLPLGTMAWQCVIQPKRNVLRSTRAMPMVLISGCANCKCSMMATRITSPSIHAKRMAARTGW